MLPRIGEPWRQDAPYRDRPGVYAVIREAGGRLLCVDQDGEWQLPGGGIDPGESPLRALHREVMEETGWRIAPVRLVARFQRYVFMPDYGWWVRKVQAIYLADAVRAHGAPLEAGHRPIRLAPAEAAASLGIEGDRRVVARLIARRLV
ncbi:MAG: NUDIX domain-containing protein [Paracoccaceae bacterium]